MASHIPTFTVEDRSERYTVPAYNPSDYYSPRNASSDYYTPAVPHSQYSSLDVRGTMNQEGCFALPPVSPGLPLPSPGGRDSAATILLDRFSRYHAHPSGGPDIPRTSGAPAHHAYGQMRVLPQAPSWKYTQTPVTPGNPRNVWSFMSQGQSLPPPPPGPPPRENRLSRSHSVVKEIVVPPSDERPQSRALSTDASTCAFRQPARGQAPKPLRDRELASIAPKVPSYPAQQSYRSSRPLVPAPKSNPGKRTKPAPIDIQLAEGRSTRQPVRSAPIEQRPVSLPDEVQRAREESVLRLQGVQSPPQTACFYTARRQTNPVSPTRGLPLSPLNTKVAKPSSQKGILVDVVLSPSLSPQVANPRSPISLNGRNTRSSTPSLFSPETPVAMSFDFPIIISDSEPPAPTLEWLNDRPQTIIEEDIQEETPLEVYPNETRFVEYAKPARARARSMSPPNSAYPDESSFSWDKFDLGNRHATDETFYEGSQSERGQMMEDHRYTSQKRGFNPRQTILGSYFGQ